MHLSAQLAVFKRVSQRFVEKSSNLELRAVFPGYVASPGDCLFPACIPVEQDFSSFIIRSGKDAKSSLCFSKALFIGKVKGEQEPRDLAEFGEYSQSSCHQSSRNLEAGASGTAFSNNVHTLAEEGPWWRVEFPDNVRVSHILFYPRTDWHITNVRHIRIMGQDASGAEMPLYYPEKKSFRMQDVPARIETAVDALGVLSESVPAAGAERFNTLVGAALETLSAKLEDALLRAGSPLGARVKRLIGRQSAASAPADDAREERAVCAEQILEAISLGLGDAKDFGCAEDEALTVALGDIEARHIRFRIYGGAPGLGGAEFFGASGQSVASFNTGDLKFRYNRPPHACAQSYALGLLSQIRSRRHDLGKAQRLNSMRVWNLNPQHSANTLFLEIAVRKTDGEPWTIVYDHGGPYRAACQALGLVNMLVASAITPAYTRLLGKMFTQYRRTQLMTPVARLFRKRKELNDAVFEGSGKISAATRHAAPLRLGKHGLGVPIAYRDQKVVMGQLVEMRDNIRALGFKPLLMYGTLLGAIREKDFIPHDDDVDLAILMEGVGPDELNDECSRIIGILNDAGIKATRGALHSPLIHCRRPPVTYDIFILGCVGDKVYWPHKALAVVPERADIFLPLGELEFKGEIFDAPNNPEAVCEARYGSDWHIPNPAFEW